MNRCGLRSSGRYTVQENEMPWSIVCMRALSSRVQVRIKNLTKYLSQISARAFFTEDKPILLDDWARL